MLKAQTGASTKADPAQAGQEAATKAKSGLQNPKLAFVYSGTQYDQAKLLAAIGRQLPGVPLIGNTSFTGVITNEGLISSDDGFVGILALAGDNLTVGRASSVKRGSARDTGREVALAALAAAKKHTSGKIEPPSYFYMVAPPGEE
jgi:hypothetical protein